MKKKKILVTGAAGFVGTNFLFQFACREDIKNNYDFVIADALTYAGNFDRIRPLFEIHQHLIFCKIDITNKEELGALFTKHAFDGVINYAAESHVDQSIESPDKFVQTNIIGTHHLLKESLGVYQKTQNEHFRYLQVSTDEVYGSLNSHDLPFTELTSIAPNSPYSASKASADLLVRSYFETFGLPTITTRCSNNFGPYQNAEKFIPVVISKAWQNESVPIYGSGRNIRDWIHVDDHNHGIWLAFEKGRPGEIYNFGGGQELENIELAMLILKKLNKPESLLKMVTDRKGHDWRYAINFNKSKSELAWGPKRSILNDLESVIQTYLPTSS
ncbi:MAG: dTDP-glucose 4,6-dehydratase [Bacteriovoracaceae bacterium]|nr:dTDP-glucose 4,6-dehydratase [Bacteriovoracaceae bacterium]